MRAHMKHTLCDTGCKAPPPGVLIGGRDGGTEEWLCLFTTGFGACGTISDKKLLCFKDIQTW